MLSDRRVPRAPLLLGCLLLLSSVLGCSSGGGSGDGGMVIDPPPDRSVLLDPSLFNETAPETFVARFVTTRGTFRVEVERVNAPLGADRFFNLVRNGYYDEVRFFRVISGFVAQFGVNGDPAVNTVWQPQRIDDDPVVLSNVRGTLTFATGGPNTRTTQLFVNFGDNTFLDAQGFSPLGQIIEGMAVVDALFAAYGDSVDQGRLQREGNAYLDADFPDLDFVITATIE